MHLRHNTKCKELYSEEDILNIKRELTLLRNTRFSSKLDNKIAKQKYNKAYNEKQENKLSKQVYNLLYNEMPENKTKKKEYNTNNNKVYYGNNSKKILTKKRMKTYQKGFIKHVVKELNDSELRFGQDWHDCVEEGRENCSAWSK